MNQNKRTELLVGATILVALCILIGGVLWLKEVNVSRSRVTYSVLFPNVSTLQKGDPVMVNGVQKGAVKRISLYRDSVLVLINVDKGIRLTDSSLVRVQNVGIMGERAIGIELSSKGTAFTPGENRPHIPGMFDTGIAEAMGMLGTILGDVELLLAQITGVVDSTVGAPSFTQQFNRIVYRLNSVTEVADNLVQEHKYTIDEAIRNIEAVSTDIKYLVDTNKDDIDTSITNLKTISSKVTRLTSDIDSVTGSLKSITRAIENGEGTMGKLMEDEQLYSGLKESITNLDSLAAQIRRKGMKVKIKLGW